MALYDVSTSEKKASPELVAGGTLYADSPVGTILPFGGSNLPSGFLFCQGQEVSKTTYAELYSVIGDSFGTASDSTKFVIPDMRESVPKGAGLTGHTVGAHLDADGLAVGEFLDDRIQEHIHRFSSDNSNVGTANCAREGGAISQDNITPDGEVKKARSGATTEVKSVGVNYIIKAKMIGVPADLASGVEEYINDNAKSPISTNNKLVTESDIYPYKTNTNDKIAKILNDIKASTEAVDDYKKFSGDTLTDIEGSWFGYKKTSNFWHCEVFTGEGNIIHLIYNKGTYIQRFII